ncbi:MAG TPA: OmpH family outer membrane protein [Flavobacteriales bacterium]|jgi:outer membrane protein
MQSKISIVLSALALILAGFAFFKKPEAAPLVDTRTGEPAKVAEALNGDSGPRPVVVAYINADTINEHYQFIVEKRKQLESKLKTAEANVRKEYQSRESEVKRLLQYAERNPNLSQSEQVAIQNDIMRMEQEMATIQERAMTSIEKERDILDTELHDKVKKYLENYSKQRGIDYVFNYQEGLRVILYGTDAYDITAEVLAGLNAEYAQEKESKK